MNVDVDVLSEKFKTFTFKYAKGDLEKAGKRLLMLCDEISAKVDLLFKMKKEKLTLEEVMGVAGQIRGALLSGKSGVFDALELAGNNVDNMDAERVEQVNELLMKIRELIEANEKVGEVG